MRARLLIALAAGLMVGSPDPAPDRSEVQSQVIPPGSRWTWTGFDGLPRVDEFNKGGVWLTVFPRASCRSRTG